jgi:hypothetical protein
MWHTHLHPSKKDVRSIPFGDIWMVHFFHVLWIKVIQHIEIWSNMEFPLEKHNLGWNDHIGHISKNDHIGQILEFPLEKTHISSYLKYGLSILPGWPFWPMFTWQKEEHLLESIEDACFFSVRVPYSTLNKVVPPFTIAKLVYKLPLRWFYDTYNYSMQDAQYSWGL